MNAAAIRQSFLDYFAARDHETVASSSLVPRGDATLLFTNAGMVQFKRVFQGLETRGYDRAVTSQKCVRAGGKHNDLEQVGHTARHHTFFEMLGNFSFGDYFKRDAIRYAWEWVTSDEYLGISPELIFATVHHTDDEAGRLWHTETGLPTSRIFALGDADNFWQMGDTGPCGPCSEIYVDLRTPEERGAGGGTLGQTEFERLAESGRLLEIWNLVFMQFDQAPDGTRTPLPAPSVDTGAGLERIASVMQGVASNFDTDLFTPIIRRAEEVIGTRYDRGPSGAAFRVLADHARAVAFLLADGVSPSSSDRGYVLRRILRRAVRHAYLLGRTEPTLVHLADVVVETMGSVFPELAAKRDHIANVTRAEEERFLETIDGGLARLEALTTGSPGIIAGSDAFKLYDTFGFPLDLTQVIAREKGWKVDVAGFDAALAKQRKRSGADSFKMRDVAVVTDRPRGKWIRAIPRKRQRFVGYETTRAETDVLAYRESGGRLELILRDNPFYAESGGQVSDTGVVRADGWELRVDEVAKIEGKQSVSGPAPAAFEPTPVEAVVAETRRRDIERNHTATHLVHAALRNVLGTHVVQAGSVVAPDRLRFDFQHFAPVGDEDLRAIEREVNDGIWQNVPVETYEMSYDDAIAKGVMALFGEKYGDKVRVVDIPSLSAELCGGTHVRSTGQIGLFHFTGETGVAAGVRRMEAVTGPGAYELVKLLGDRIDEVSESLRTAPEHLTRKIDALLDERRQLEKQIEDLLRGSSAAGAAGREERVEGVRVLMGDAPVSDRAQIGMLMDKFRGEQSGAVSVLFTGGDRPGIFVGLTDDLVSRGLRAGELVKRIAAVSGGSGGGRPHFASGGLGDLSKLDATRSRVPTIVREALVAAGE